MVRCRYSAVAHTTPNSMAKMVANPSERYRLSAEKSPSGLIDPSTRLNRTTGISNAHQAEVDRALRISETTTPRSSRAGQERRGTPSVGVDITGLLPAEQRRAGPSIGLWSAADIPFRGCTHRHRTGR